MVRGGRSRERGAGSDRGRWGVGERLERRLFMVFRGGSAPEMEGEVRLVWFEGVRGRGMDKKREGNRTTYPAAMMINLRRF